MTPTWQLRCTSCNHTTGTATIVRVHAASIGQRTLGRCSNCVAVRYLAIEPEGTTPKALESDQTWAQLAVFVAAGSLTVHAAEQIAASPASELRKRQVAASVASGAITPQTGLRELLS